MLEGFVYWKFNNSLLKNKTYVDEVKQCINKVKEQYILPIYNLEFIKNNTNNDLLEFTISNQLFLEMRGRVVTKVVRTCDPTPLLYIIWQ